MSEHFVKCPRCCRSLRVHEHQFTGCPCGEQLRAIPRVRWYAMTKHEWEEWEFAFQRARERYLENGPIWEPEY